MFETSRGSEVASGAHDRRVRLFRPSKMHHENQLTREKTEEEQHSSPIVDFEAPSTESESDGEGLSSPDDVALVNFQPGEPGDPHNWSMVSPDLIDNTQSSS